MDLKLLEETAPWDWPPDTDQALLRALTSDATPEAERILAASLAGEYCILNDELADALLHIVADGSGPDELRGRAAISLGPVLEQGYIEEFEDPEAVPISEPLFHEIQQTLRRVYEDRATPVAVRRSCLEASVRAPQEWHRDAVRSAYLSGDEDWQLTAVFCMGYIRGFDQEILEALQGDSPDLHYHAVVAAGNWSLEGAWPHIAGLVASDDIEKPLLLAAIEAAAMLRPEEAQELFFELMDSDDEDIVDAIDDALALAQRPWDEEDDDLDFDFDDDRRRH